MTQTIIDKIALKGHQVLKAHEITLQAKARGYNSLKEIPEGKLKAELKRLMDELGIEGEWE